MVARIWRGTVLRGDGDHYVAYVEQTGIKQYRETPGNLGAYILRRDLEEKTEVVTLTFWESLESIRAFTGDDVTLARYYPEDDQYLIERTERVEHYDVPVTSPGDAALPWKLEQPGGQQRLVAANMYEPPGRSDGDPVDSSPGKPARTKAQ